jgi:hypothetical protein
MSNTVVPPRFLFRWSFPVPYWADVPGAEGPLPELTEAHQLPALSGLDGAIEYATWRIGWNEAGLAVCVDVTGKTRPVRSDPLAAATSSGVHVWLDTRCTQNVHRATKFCHRFSLLPGGAGRQKSSPRATALPLAQAREEAPARGAAVRITSQLRDDGYRLQAWFPAESLTGYDPAAHPRLGFYGVVLDDELGLQPLTVGGEFPYESDPSLWQTLELMGVGR